jgi:UDP-N-acetylglucosamine 2-epimerase (non-hydrolysing)
MARLLRAALGQSQPQRAGEVVTPRALDGVSVAVAPGALPALLGSNGAGNATLLHSLTGLLSPSAIDRRSIGSRATRTTRGWLPKRPNRVGTGELSIDAMAAGAVPQDEPQLVVHAVGARPNFVKMAPVIDALRRQGVSRQLVVHTGQHYDSKMSDEILEDLDFPPPDCSLGVGSGTHGEQTAKVLMAFEEILLQHRPGLVVVAGDVNSTLACALAASKLGVRVAHLEAGLRSGDWTMPEEINRVLTDRLSDVLLTHSPEAESNLEREGVDVSRVHYVGNTMIDSLRRFECKARDRARWRTHEVDEGEYLLVTLHRPSNVDEPGRLSAIVTALTALGRRFPIVFPVHPRTRARLCDASLLTTLEAAGVRCIDPAGYLDFLSLQAGAGAIVTDSGGIQEEASALGIRCYTLRANTERPVTITHGTNTLLGDRPSALLGVHLSGHPPTPSAIPLWDGHAAERAAAALLAEFPAIAPTDLVALA